MGPIGRGIVRAFLVVVLAGGIGGEPVETSYFWSTEGIGDGPNEGYTQDTLAEWQRMLWNQDPTTEGVATTYQGGLAVTAPGGLVLRVASGGGVVYGYGYRSTGNVDHTLVLPVLGNTGWRVVLRTDWATRTVRSALLQSADGVAAIPAVTQVAGVTWEISLAYGIVSVAGAVTIQGDDRTPLGSGGRFIVGTDDIADEAVTAQKIANRTRVLSIQPNWVSTNYLGTTWPNFIGVGDRGWYVVAPTDCSVGVHFEVPADYVSGGTISLITTVSNTGGNIRRLWSTLAAGRDGEAWNIHNYYDAAAVVEGVPATAHTIKKFAEKNISANLAAGDIVTGVLELIASDATWTNTGILYVKMFRFTYTADS